MEARDHLLSANHIFLRTTEHPAANFLKQNNIHFTSFDALYEECADYEELYYKISLKLIEEAKEKDVTYCVPGNPFFAEESIHRILELSRSKGLRVKFIPGMSFLDEVIAAAEMDPVALGLRIVDAHRLADCSLSSDQNILVVQLSSKLAASDVKLELLHHFPPEHPVNLIDSVSNEVKAIHLLEIDSLKEYSPTASLFVPALPVEKAISFEDFVSKISKLRSPGGCPWDREQTHLSLRHHLLEESYEVLEALDDLDLKKLEGELGDLLLQIVLHAQIASEEGVFSMSDVLKSINEKIVRRHPHIFGEEEAESPEAVRVLWEDIKREEEGHQLFEGLPRELPSLLYSQKIQNKAAHMGFDWESAEGIVDKIGEEVDELMEVVEAGGDVEDELGDLLFSLVNLSRRLEIDAEGALRRAGNKFRERLVLAIELAKNDGHSFEKLPLDEKEEYWEKAKEIIRDEGRGTRD